MQFLNPWFLFGLLAIAIPIAVHLFNFRRYRKVYFSNVQFLKELQKQTRKQSKLLHRLILLTRILAFLFIVLAFAQPIFSWNKEAVTAEKNQIASFYIDNSFSMEAEGSKGSLLDEAKEKVREALTAYDQDDRFQLLTNDFEGKHQRLVSKDEFTVMLNEVKPSSALRSMYDVVARQNDLLTGNERPHAVMHYISDFQKSTLMDRLPDSGFSKGYLIPLRAANLRNLFIDSCWFSSPLLQINQSAVLTVRVSNVSETDLEKIPVRLIIEGAQRAVASVDVSAGTSSEINFTFTNSQPGRFKGHIEIDDYPVTYDDLYYFTYKISPEIRVLSINENTDDSYLNSVYRVDSIINLTNTTSRQIDVSSFPTYKLIILNRLSTYSTGLINEITKFVQNGGSLLIVPPVKSDIPSQNALLSNLGTGLYRDYNTSPLKVGSINNNHPIYKEVFDKGTLKSENLDLPRIAMHYSLAQSSRTSGETLLELENNEPLMVYYTLDAGKIYLFTAPLNDEGGNFVRHALYVPTMLNIAFQSEKLSPLMYYTNTHNPVPVNGRIISPDNVILLKHTESDFQFIPEYRQVNGKNFIFLNGQITQSGVYQLVSNNEVIEDLAFNYDRRESDIAVADEDDLALLKQRTGFEIIENSQKPLNVVLNDETKGNKYWQWFLIAALAALLAETILIAFFKKTTTTV